MKAWIPGHTLLVRRNDKFMVCAPIREVEVLRTTEKAVKVKWLDSGHVEWMLIGLHVGPCTDVYDVIETIPAEEVEA